MSWLLRAIDACTEHSCALKSHMLATSTRKAAFTAAKQHFRQQLLYQINSLDDASINTTIP